MLFSDLALARRLEQAEGRACVHFAEVQHKTIPESRAEWMECAGTYAVFNGVDSPVTQTYCLGIFEDLTATSLDVIERFFFERGSSVDHEVCPLAGVATLNLLCRRGYKPIEISNVLYRTIEDARAVNDPNITVRVTTRNESKLWADINARGWASGQPEILESILKFSTLISADDQHPCFLAELNGQPGAAGALSVCNGVALFGGASTIPEMRQRGLQSALLQERMRYAFQHNCDLAMMVAEAGSNSQRNAERKGFRIAYTRIKWRLPHA
jgi:hypothetical protein